MKYTKKEIIDAYENRTLFVKCLNTFKDDKYVYNILTGIFILQKY